MTTEERFWSCVKKTDGCWLWQKSTCPPGWYGQFFLRKEGRKSINVSAHRFVWELTNGPIPDGLHVCHRCDVPACVNPEHLFLGTQAENIKDAWRKERSPRGGKRVQAKLVESDISKIRSSLLSNKMLAKLFSVSDTLIRGIRAGERWRHVSVVALIIVSCLGCARTDIYWPPDGKSVVVGENGRVSRAHNRAVVLNGSDSLGNTVIELNGKSLRFASAGGIDNSTATGMGYRTLRYGIGAAATVAGAAVLANAASSAYDSNQAAEATSNVAASRAASAQTATRAATRVRLAEIQAQSAAQAARAASRAAAPAAGSVIPSVVPATVTPIIPVP